MLARIAPIMGLALVLGGCVSQPVAQTATRSLPEIALPTLPSFLAPVSVSVFKGTEPLVAVAPDGSYWITGIMGSGQGNWLSHSTDGGKTWTDVPLPNTMEVYPPSTFGGRSVGSGGGDSSIAFDEKGGIYVLDLLGLAVTPLYISHDNGKTWETNYAPNPSKGVDREWIAVRDGVIYIQYQKFGTEGELVAVSTDGGKTFSETVAYPESGPPVFYMDPWNGNLYIVHRSFSDQSVRVTISVDGAKTWKSHVVHKSAQSTNFVKTVTTDAAGNIYAAWTMEFSDKHVIHVSKSANQGETWSEPAQLNALGTTAVFPWLVAGADGNVAAAWVQFDEEGDPNFLPNDAQWRVVGAVSSDHGATWQRSILTPEPMHVGNLCTNGTFCAAPTNPVTGPGGNRGLGDFVSIAVGKKGELVATWANDAMGITTPTGATVAFPFASVQASGIGLWGKPVN